MNHPINLKHDENPLKKELSNQSKAWQKSIHPQSTQTEIHLGYVWYTEYRLQQEW